MNKIIISIVVIILTLLSIKEDRRDKVIVKNETFSVIYSEKLEQPLEVEYEVKCTNNIYSRRGLDFYKVDGIITSDDQDYSNNFYDKGHLAPAANFNCNEKMLYETFSYLNCALQHQDLNRGAWKYLENYERMLALKYKVSVKVKCTFSKKSTILDTGATVPDGFYKILKYNNKIEVYYFPNIKPTSRKFRDFKIKES